MSSNDTKEKAMNLVDGFRFILIKSNTDAGEEILCTLLAKECALVAVDELINCSISYDNYNATWASQVEYWQEVKTEIEKL